MKVKLILFYVLIKAAIIQAVELFIQDDNPDKEFQHMKVKYKDQIVRPNSTLFDIGLFDTDFKEKMDRLLTLSYKSAFNIPESVLIDYQKKAPINKFSEKDLMDQEKFFQKMPGYKIYLKKFADSKEEDYKMRVHALGNYLDQQTQFDRFRFMQTADFNAVQLRKQLIKSDKQKIQLRECWASSMFDNTGLPCQKNKIRSVSNNQAWVSKPVQNTQIVTFRAEFQGKSLVRFSDLTINWEQCPEFISIEIAREPGQFYEIIPLKSTHSLSISEQLDINIDRFEQFIEFSKPVYASAFRLNMTKPKNYQRIIMLSITAFVKQQTVMFRSKVRQLFVHYDLKYLYFYLVLNKLLGFYTQFTNFYNKIDKSRI